MKNKISKTSKRRLVFLAPISLILIFYFFINLVNFSYNLIKLKNEEKKLSTELKTLQKEETNKKNNLKKLQDADYIARFARENYLYSKEDEYVIKMEEKEKVEKQEKENKKEYRYIIAGSAGLVILLSYVFIKSNIKIKNKENN